VTGTRNAHAKGPAMGRDASPAQITGADRGLWGPQKKSQLPFPGGAPSDLASVEAGHVGNWDFAVSSPRPARPEHPGTAASRGSRDAPEPLRETTETRPPGPSSWRTVATATREGSRRKKVGRRGPGIRIQRWG